MCGCQTCIIFKDMYACLKMWQKKYISRQQGEIDAIHQRSRTLTARQNQLDEYISKVMKDGEITPVRAWDAAAELACPKVEIENGNGSGSKSFHKFGCAMGECNECPKWNTIVPKLEIECNDHI